MYWVKKSLLKVCLIKAVHSGTFVTLTVSH